MQAEKWDDYIHQFVKWIGNVLNRPQQLEFFPFHRLIIVEHHFNIEKMSNHNGQWIDWLTSVDLTRAFENNVTGLLKERKKK